jgi:hypothetical protein
MDEITAALSISFNSTGSKYALFIKMLGCIHVAYGNLLKCVVQVMGSC